MKKEEQPSIEDKHIDQVSNSGQETNRIMGIAAIFISVLSMVAVIYQSYLAREENELIRIQQSATVLPYLDYWYSNVGMEHKFVLENKGLGPAFIKDVKFIGKNPDGKDSLNFNSSNLYYEYLEKQSSYFDSVHVIKESLNANELLSPNEEKVLFLFTFDTNNQKRRFRDEYNKHFAGMKIIYEDVYGTAWILNSETGYPVKYNK